MIYGIDIGGTKTEITIFDDNLDQKDNWRIKTPTKNYQEFISALSLMIFEADEKFNVKGKVGIGMPGIADQNGKSLSANIAIANGKNVSKDLEGLIHRTVLCENDCRCFALSEANGGAGNDFKSVYCAIIGTGAAGGYVVNNELVLGRQKIAGEYGHLQLPSGLKEKYNLPSRECGCGLSNCYEGYVSGPGLEFIYNHITGNNAKVPDIVQEWRTQSNEALKAFDCYMDILGSCFSNLILNYDPHAIVLGGGISLIDEIVEGLEVNINKHMFRGFNAPPIYRAKFGDASGARGAALLARGNI